MTNQIVLVGGGGHCRACINVIESSEFKIAGIIDKESAESILDYPILGCDDKLESLANGGHLFLVTVGQVKNASTRTRLFEKIRQVHGKLATVFAGTSCVSRHTIIGQGTIIMHHALVNACVTIGENCIINNKALVEHDCIVGDHSHISTGAIINGNCIVGNRVFIGSNSVLINGIQIGNDVVIGAGSVVLKDILTPGVYAGNPAKRIG